MFFSKFAVSWDLKLKSIVCFPDARLCVSYYNCKYVETSASLNHHVDNLLVGILSQIRLKLNPDKLLKHMEKMSASPSHIKQRHSSLKSAKGILHKLFNRQKSLSCDNLYDLWTLSLCREKQQEVISGIRHRTLF